MKKKLLQWTKLLFAINLFLMVTGVSIAQEKDEEKVSITPGLLKAHELSMRVYDKTRQHKESALILEEAGISALKSGKPDDMAVQKYVQILLDYSKILFHIGDRYLEVEPLLLMAKKYQPDEQELYLLMGDVYHRKHQVKPSPKLQVKYTSYYQDYLDVLKRKKLRVLLPPRITTALYDTREQNVCAFIEKLNRDHLDYDLDNFFNPEKKSEMLKRGDSGGFMHGENNFTFSEFTSQATGQVRKSYSDIDNDGVEDIRYSYVDADNCQRNLFYQQLSNTHEVFTHKLLDRYYQSGYLCGTDSLHVFEYNRKRYLMEKKGLPDGLKAVIVYDVGKQDRFENMCAFNIGTISKYKVESDCQAEICQKIRGNHEIIIVNEGRVGIEKQVLARGQLQFSQNVMGDAKLRQFAESPYLYKVDIDNDGELEMIARLWPSKESGLKSYEFRLFKEINNQWRHYPLPKPTGETEIIPDTTYFFVEAYNNKNYIVSYNAYQQVKGKVSSVFYKMKVYKMSLTSLEKVGELLVKANNVTTK